MGGKIRLPHDAKRLDTIEKIATSPVTQTIGLFFAIAAISIDWDDALNRMIPDKPETHTSTPYEQSTTTKVVHAPLMDP